MLLFLIAQASADAEEVADRIQTARLPPLERELIRSLVFLTRGQTGSITNDRRSSAAALVEGSGPERATNALYFWILKGVQALAVSLQGEQTSDTTDPIAVFRQVKVLAAPRVTPAGEAEGPGPAAIFPGPFHLASLLVAIGEALMESAIVKVVPPSNLDPNRWQRSLRVIAKDRPYLWTNHKDAISKGCLEAGISSVVSFPTGAGKTTIAQLKIMATLLADRKAIVLAPTHALVDQTAQELKTIFPNSSVQGERVDEFEFSEDLDDLPDIFVMTPEACLLFCHMEPVALTDVGLLVFDECHLIHPRNTADKRSVDAMLCLINFVRVAPSADLLLLSAMIDNADELAAWLTELTGRTVLALSMAWKPTRQLRGCVVYDQRRITRLRATLANARSLVETTKVPPEIACELTAQPLGLFCIQQTWASRESHHYALFPIHPDPIPFNTNSSWQLTPNAGVLASALAAAASESGVKVLVFSQSIPNAAKNADRVSEALGSCAIKLNDKEKRWFDIAVEELGGIDQLYIDVQEGQLVSRAASHHGQLLPEERYLVESLYKRRDGLTVLAATPTLGQGVNLPSEMVIVADDSRFDRETDQRELLEARELLNAAGRAGRAGQNATGIVLVIPGRIVEVLNLESTVHGRWPRVRNVLSSSDQCLVLDDPFTALMDRIHSCAKDIGDFERYAVSRLIETTDDNSGNAVTGLVLDRTFAAFRARKSGSHDWVASRTQAALTFLNEASTATEETNAVRELASTLGFPEDIMAALRQDVMNASLGSDATVLDWRNWMWLWLSGHVDAMMRLVGVQELEYLFGKPFSRLPTNSDRAMYALQYLEPALDLWMGGEPLNKMQTVLPNPSRERRKSTGARKFVVRLLPVLAHLFGAPLTIVRQHLKDTADLSTEPSPALLYINRCIRRGFLSCEMAALHEIFRSRRLSRRQLHKIYADLEPYISDRAGTEDWTAIRDRMEAAISSELNSRES